MCFFVCFRRKSMKSRANHKKKISIFFSNFDSVAYVLEIFWVIFAYVLEFVRTVAFGADRPRLGNKNERDLRILQATFEIFVWKI